MSVIINGTSGGVFTPLQGPLTLFVRTVPVSVSLSNGSPCVATWTAHGLRHGDPVVFSSPYDLGGTVELGNPSLTITNANPGVATLTNHGYALNDPISFDTTGALPTGLTNPTIYFVVSPTANTFQIAATPSGAGINTTGTQSGNHYVWRNNTIPSGVIDGAIYFVLNVIDANNFTFSKTVGGPAINTTSAQVGKIIGQTGNDKNNGLSQTRDGAFLTVGKAWRLICGTVNTNAQIVTVQLAHGTYFGGSFTDNTSGDTDGSPTFCSDTLTAAVAAFWLGAGEVLFLGDPLNPDAVRWVANTNGRGAIDTNCDFDGNQTFKGMRLEYSGAPGFGVDYFQTLGFNTVILDTIVFGAFPNGGSLPNTASGNRIDVREGTCQLVNPCRVLANNFNGAALFFAEGSGTFFKNDNTSGPIIGINNPNLGVIYQGTDNGFVKVQLPVYQGLWNYSNIASVDVNATVANHIGFLGSANPLPNPGTPPIVNDRAFYFEFESPTTQTAAMHGVPGCPVDLFYIIPAPLTGFSITLNNSNGHVILNPAGALAAGTIVMSPNPWYGQIVNVQSTQTITAMTFSPNAGQSVKNAPTTLAPGQRVQAFFDGSPNNVWYFSN